MSYFTSYKYKFKMGGTSTYVLQIVRCRSFNRRCATVQKTVDIPDRVLPRCFPAPRGDASAKIMLK